MRPEARLPVVLTVTLCHLMSRNGRALAGHHGAGFVRPPRREVQSE